MFLRLMEYNLFGMVSGFVLDAIFGDPDFAFHPVRLIGMYISFLEKKLYPSENRRKNGKKLVVAVLLTVLLTVEIIRIAAYMIHPAIYVITESVLVWFCLARTSLRKESMKVYYALKDNDVEKARYAVSMIVGRDTQKLSDAGIIRAAVETVAENTSDGVVAPLIFTALFGSVGGFVYKAVNTMDSMIGYKNDKYIDFGRCAAKLDDVFNYIPSRMSAFLMIAAAYLSGMDYGNAFRIFVRDRLKHASPNSAQTESVCAGALNLRLAGDAWYGGELYRKDYIGDDNRECEPYDIKRACRLMSVTGTEALVIAALIKAVIIVVINITA